MFARPGCVTERGAWALGTRAWRKTTMHDLDAPERRGGKPRFSQLVACASAPMLIAAAILLAAPSAANAEEKLVLKKECFEKCVREQGASWISTGDTARRCRNVCNIY